MTAQRRTLEDRRDRALGPGYRLFYEQPLHIVRGSGVHLYDESGEEFLDVYNNVPCVGHANAHVVRAIAEQSAVLNTHTRYLHEGIVDYSERLLATTGGVFDHVIFTCSGSEAVDLALRIAAAHTRSTGVVVTENAYHGTTTRVAQVSPSMGPATPLGADVRLAPVPDVFTGDPDVAGEMSSAVDQAIADLSRHGLGFSALLIDTVLSSDGLLVDDPGFLAEVYDVVKQRGGVFIADEVQAGFGRTGSMWGFQRHGIRPDMAVLGKPMGNGMPVGAVLVRREMLDLFEAGADYFNTFAGNPVSMAAASAVLDELQRPGFLQRVTDVGDALTAQLRDMAAESPLLGRVRGAGLFISVDTKASPATSSLELTRRFIEGLRDENVLIGSCGRNRDILKLRPPLVFSADDASRFMERFRRVHDRLVSELA